MTDEILRIELRLLLLRHGRRRVLDVLATLGDQTPEQVEEELRAAEARKTKRTRKTHSASDVLAEIVRERPDAAETLRVLATRYENRAFLPQLRDVQRFLDRSGVAHKTLRSRRDAARKVMIALSRLTIDELNRLVAQPEDRASSDYAELAREIMGRRR